MGLSRALVLGAPLVVAQALAGCFLFADEPAAPARVETPEPDPDATLPQGRGEASAFKETNRTESGVGGKPHDHDLWKGSETLVLFQADVVPRLFPLFPGGSSPGAVAFVKLPPPTIVLEGTDRIAFVARSIDLEPAPPLRVQWRTAADSDWRAAVPVSYDVPLETTLLPKETDLPHSPSSLFMWRLEWDRPTLAIVNVTITAHKGATVVDFPGHPDLYADGDEREILNGTFTTRDLSFQNGLLYGEEGTWIVPEKLIAHNTTRLNATVRVIDVRAEQATFPDACCFAVAYHNASVIGPERSSFPEMKEVDHSDDGRTFNATLEVHPFGHDGPYQQKSRWGFRVTAATWNYGTAPYEVEFEMRLVAIREPPPAQAP